MRDSERFLANDLWPDEAMENRPTALPHSSVALIEFCSCVQVTGLTILLTFLGRYTGAIHLKVTIFVAAATRGAKGGCVSDLSNDVDSALAQFARLGPAIERGVLAPLLTTAGAAPAARDERFSQGVDKFIEHIRSDTPGRVQTFSILWRITSVSAMREHRRRVIDAMKYDVPPFLELPTDMPDPDDRRHFGDAIMALAGNWLPDYIARAIVNERDGEKARESLSRALVVNVPDLSAQLSLIGGALNDVRFDQQDPSVGRARRLAAILDALGAAVWTAELDIEPGEEFGSVTAKLVSDILARRPAGDRTVSIIAARSVLQFVVQAVRLHGTLAADARTYTFLDPLRRSLGTKAWPSELSSELGRAANQLLEQLVFLVRLKMPDTNLRRLFLSMVGDAVGKNRLAKLADEVLGIDADMAYWLRTGSQRRVLPTQSAVEETAVAAIDRDLGLALRETEIIRSSIAAIESEALSAAEFHSPRLEQDLKDAFGRIDRLAAYVEAVARRRSLVLKGSVGEVIAFSPLEHEPVASAVGARTVRIKSRGVERVIDGQPLGVIVKADVESA